MYDMVGIGELLVDFIPKGKSGKDNALYEANPGGAPANFLAALSKLGHKTAFIGKVGDDEFGHLLADTLQKTGIGTEGLVYSTEYNTTLVFVHLAELGERSFSFYRKPGADMMLQPNEVNGELLSKATYFNFGGVALSKEPTRGTTLTVAKQAKDRGLTVTYDPNLRPLLWDSLELAKEVMLEGMHFAHIVKVSEEELEFFTGMTDLEQGANLLRSRYGVELVLVSLGAEGCYYQSDTFAQHVPGFPVQPIDTTGAGDACFGGFVSQLIRSKLAMDELSGEQLTSFARFANQVGALVTTKEGALQSMPSSSDIEAHAKLKWKGL